MTSRVASAFPLQVVGLVGLAVLSGAAAFGQGSTPAPVISPATSDTAPPQPSSVPSPQPSVILSYGTPGKHVIVLEDTMIRVMTNQPLNSEKSKDGTKVTFTVSEDLVVNHVLAIPRGATAHGEVVGTKRAGKMNGSPELTLKLNSLELGAVSYPLYTYHFKALGESKTKPTGNELGEGAEFGALAGAVVSARQKGGPTQASNVEDIASGAAVGAGAVALSPLLTPRPVLDLPAESEMDFYLAAPISVQPVSEKEAERLAGRLPSGGPVLYVRSDHP